MRPCRTITLFIFTALLAFNSQTSRAAIGDFLGSIGVATGQQKGLVWKGGSLWLTDQSWPSIFEIDPSNGNILNQIFITGIGSAVTQGLAWDGTNFYVSAANVIYKVDTGGNVIDSFNYGMTMWGLEWNGSRLLAINNIDDIYTINTTTWGIDSTLLFGSHGIGGLTGLTWDGSTLWVAQQGTDTFFQLNPGTGATISSFTDAGAGSITDITIDGSGNIRAADDALNSIRTYEGPGITATPLGLEGWGGLGALGLSAWFSAAFSRRRRATGQNGPPAPGAGGGGA